jgi:ribosomal protein L11 methylase PrmA
MILELTIDVPRDGVDLAVREAYALGVQGLQVRDDEGSGAPPGRAQVICWLDANAPPATDALVAALGGDARVTLAPVALDWPGADDVVHVGRRLAILPPEHLWAWCGPRHPVAVDGRVAFGDGLHPTTVLSLLAVERACGRRAPRTLLDVGTGTGVLAIAAARLVPGLRPVAVDVDPLARAAAEQHAAVNDVPIDVRDAVPEGRFEVVLANLYRHVLLELGPTLARAVCPGGRLFVSGLRASDVAPVDATLRAAGLRFTRRAELGGWAGLSYTRPAPRV